MEILNNFISWTHILAATFSLIIGAIVLFNVKGTAQHKKLGLYYFWLQVINNVTALFIFNATGKWFFPHWLAVATLVIIIPGYWVTFYKNWKHWLKVHIISFILSYYLLIGGAINEAFLHIESLRPLLINGSPVVGMVHFAAQIIFIGLLIYNLRKHRKLGMKYYTKAQLENER